MFAPSLTIGLLCVLTPLAAQPEKGGFQTVVIEAPGITCMGRFTDSLNQHIVQQHSWVDSVRIGYAPDQPRRRQGNQKLISGTDMLLSGRMSVLRFEIDKQVAPQQLAQLLKSCGYYNTKRWMLVSRVPFSTIDPSPGSKAEK